MHTSTDESALKADQNNLQKQRETYIASLSHDLKNPTLAQIRAIELLLKGNFGRVLPEQREIMEMVLDSCKYMNAMLGTVLASCGTDNGKFRLASEVVSISDLAAECIDEMVYLAQDKGIKVIYNNTAEKDTVWGDTVQIRRVIMNLLSNSIKYAYSNTELNISVYNEENYTCFSFKNSSPYLSPDRQKKIFARYVSYSKTHNGVGIGLYASKKIIEAHGGQIFVRSFEDGHNIFGFKLPNDEYLKDEERYVIF